MQDLVGTNCVYISAAAMSQLRGMQNCDSVSSPLQLQLGDLVYAAKSSKQMTASAIGLNFVQRENLAVRSGDTAWVSVVDPLQYVPTVDAIAFKVEQV